MRAFSISIWRPAKPYLPLYYYHEEKNSHAFDPKRLQEQIYSWDPGEEDVISGFDESLAVYFRETLLEAFSPHLPPESRNMKTFARAIDNFKSKLVENNNSVWVDSQQTSGDDNESINLRINSAVAILHHLSWIQMTFEHMPDISVVIR